MSSTAEKLMSLDEFLAWEREQPESYEFAGGVVTMMAAGSRGCDDNNERRTSPTAGFAGYRLPAIRERRESFSGSFRPVS
jgi:hypothetical protein